MNAVLAAIALLILASAGIALTLRNIIRSVILLVVTWFGIAAFYLWAGAEFVAFAQVLVYGGAVSMVVLFAVLLVRHGQAGTAEAPAPNSRIISALVVGGAVSGALAGAIALTPLGSPVGPAPFVPVRHLGVLLLNAHAASLLVAGAILTVALLGGVVLAAGGGARKEDGS